jgi:hypothetical protein
VSVEIIISPLGAIGKCIASEANLGGLVTFQFWTGQRVDDVSIFNTQILIQIRLSVLRLKRLSRDTGIKQTRTESRISL